VRKGIAGEQQTFFAAATPSCNLVTVSYRAISSGLLGCYFTRLQESTRLEDLELKNAMFRHRSSFQIALALEDGSQPSLQDAESGAVDKEAQTMRNILGIEYGHVVQWKVVELRGW